MATIDSLALDLIAVRSDIKSLAKLVRKVRAFQEDPTGEKAKERSANNGFNRVQAITPTLATFLGVEDDHRISRSEVTRFITKYVSENGLKHPDNGRVIILDNKLTDLLKPPEKLEITFLNIQKYLTPHYIKETVVKVEKAEKVDDAKKKRPAVKKK